MGDIDASSIDFFYEQESIKRDALSEELRIQSNPGKMIDWTAGLVFFFSHDRDTPASSTYAGGAGNPLFLGVCRKRAGHILSIRTPMRRVMRDLRKLSGTLPRPWRLLSAVDTTHEQVSQLAYNTSFRSINNLVNSRRDVQNFSAALSVNYALNDSQNV